jgi:hypothetical protein
VPIAVASEPAVGDVPAGTDFVVVVEPDTSAIRHVSPGRTVAGSCSVSLVHMIEAACCAATGVTLNVAVPCGVLPAIDSSSVNGVACV